MLIYVMNLKRCESTFFNFNFRTKDILDKCERRSKTIIFTGKKVTADELTYQLKNSGYSALAIHGDKKQAERDYVMRQFKEGRIDILIATDVAARGLGKAFNLVGGI